MNVPAVTGLVSFGEDAAGEVYVSVQDPAAGLQVFAPDGKFLRNVPNAPSDFHGFVIKKEADGEFIYGATLRGQTVVKMRLDGGIVMTIGSAQIPDQFKIRNARSGQLSLLLTGLDVAPNGDIYVTDGYASDFIHRFDKTGKYLSSFGGKAAPGYHLAKLIIRLITVAAEIINRDPGVRDLIKVVFLPNFNVTNGQHIYPAADLSEQISTAGKEASGTGNMKFQMNGALTIGTVDGANIEICEEVGFENFFLFGLEAHEVAAKRAMGYRPAEVVEGNEELQAVIQLIRDGFFSRGNSAQFQPLIDNLLYHDPYYVLADYQSYADCQASVDQSYRDKEGWTRMSILNAARSGKFSSDRTIREYCNDIWQAKPVRVQLISQEEVKAGLLQ